MTRETRLRWGLFVLTVVMMATAAFVYRATRPPTPAELVDPVRAELRQLRRAADSCQASLSRRESRFRNYNARLDSLRTRVDRYQAIDPRGVPADSYPAYMDAFDRYNASVPGWALRADTLEAHWERCLGLTEAHNVQADSLRALLLDLGLIPAEGEAFPPAQDPDEP